MAEWQLREAKARLSELIKKAASEGPQRITVRGKPAAVLISEPEYQRLRRRKPSFVELMRSSPLVGAGLDLTREQTKTRKN
jgi:prevent-host-death family protein